MFQTTRTKESEDFFPNRAGGGGSGFFRGPGSFYGNEGSYQDGNFQNKAKSLFDKL